MIYLAPVFIFLFLYVIWILYLAVMTLMRARDAGNLPAFSYRLGIPLLYIGLAIDVLTNWLIVSFIVLELPRNWTITQRLSRLKFHGKGWRQSVAIWVGDNLLDAFDPSGRHLKP